eukprot:g5473.t1
MASLADGANDNSDLLLQFVQVTGQDPEIAQAFLKGHKWDLGNAINGFYAGDMGDASGSSSSSMSVPDSNASSVRAPMDVKRQKLVDDDVHHFRAATNGQMQLAGFSAARGSYRAPARRRAQNKNAKGVNLRAEFQMPSNMVFQGSLIDAQKKATEEKKWLMVNIQDDKIWACYDLIRMVWQNEIVQSVVESSLVLFLGKQTTPFGREFMRLYKLDESQLPYVALMHPLTGAIVKVFMKGKVMDTMQFVSSVTDFLTEKEAELLAVLSPQAIPKSPVPVPKENVMAGSSHSSGDSHDTEPIAVVDDEDDHAGKGSSENAENTKKEDSMNPFGEVPSEPPTGAAETARLAIRLADGKRVNRRFWKTDLVRSIFAVVQNEMEGSKFELLAGRPPVSLSDKVGETIGAAGLHGSLITCKITT